VNENKYPKPVTQNHDWSSANDLTRSGCIAKDPKFLIYFSAKPNEVWGAFRLDDSTLLDALAWQNGVPLSKYDDWMREHANETVTIAIRGQAQELTHKLSDFPAVKKLYKQQY